MLDIEFNVSRTGEPGHFDSAVVDGVLPAVGRDYSADQSGGAFVRQIRALHHDSRHIQVGNSFIALPSTSTYSIEK